MAISSPRGQVRARARLCGVRPGLVFIPLHYGYFDVDPDDRTHRAANELALTAWDPVSKQPIFKVAAVRMTKLADGDGAPSPAPTIGAAAPVPAAGGGRAPVAVPDTAGGPAAESTSRIGAE